MDRIRATKNEYQLLRSDKLLAATPTLEAIKAAWRLLVSDLPPPDKIEYFQDPA